MNIDFASLAPTEYGNVLDRQFFADPGIRPLWPKMPRIAGPAYTVQLASGDNLGLHAAIYEAPAGSIIVVNAEDGRYAVAGGNVCATAKEHGITGFVIDGVIRDLGEIRDMRFPVFARGVFPVPGGKNVYATPNQSIVCGGACVRAGDIVVADEEGIAFIPADNAEQTFKQAKQRFDREQQLTLQDWQETHRKKIKAAINKVIYATK